MWIKAQPKLENSNNHLKNLYALGEKWALEQPTHLDLSQPIYANDPSKHGLQLTFLPIDQKLELLESIIS